MKLKKFPWTFFYTVQAPKKNSAQKTTSCTISFLVRIIIHLYAMSWTAKINLFTFYWLRLFAGDYSNQDFVSILFKIWRKNSQSESIIWNVFEWNFMGKWPTRISHVWGKRNKKIRNHIYVNNSELNVYSINELDL